MFKRYVTSEKDGIRRAVALSEAHSLMTSSFELATEADMLWMAARKAESVLDVAAIEEKITRVRRYCDEVRAGVDDIHVITDQCIDTAEAVVATAREVFSEAEHTYNHASFELNFATTISE